MFDCIIIGAGPAGSTAAYHLAKQGHRILVLEKASLSRYRPGGGGISPAIRQWLDIDFSPVISTQVTQVRYTLKMEDPVTAQLQASEPMWMVKREEFDSFLAKQAQNQGAEVREQTAVTGVTFSNNTWQVKTTGETFESQYLIVATGGNDLASEWLGIQSGKSTIAGVLEVKANVPPEHQNTAFFDFGSLKNGYIWNFPKADGYAISAAIFRGGKGKPDQLHKQLLEYAKSFGIPTHDSQFYDTILNLWSDNQPLHTQSALVVGEAAGIVDPLLGEGVRPAIFTGFKAAEAIHQALSGDSNALAQYTQTIQETWGANLALASRLAGLFYQFPKIAYKVALKRPSAATIMSQILCGESSYSEVTEKAMKTIKKNMLPGMGG